MAKVLTKAKKKDDEEAQELISPYAAPVPSIFGIKLSLVLLFLILLRLVMLCIFCLPWSIQNLVIIYKPRVGVNRQLYWSLGFRLEKLFMPVQYSGGYNTDKFREVISYIYIIDCGFDLVVALLIYITTNLKIIMILCLVWLFWGISSLGVFSWGFARFAIRKQFPFTMYYVDLAYIVLVSLILLVKYLSLTSLIKEGYISFPALNKVDTDKATLVVPKANAAVVVEQKKEKQGKVNKDLDETVEDSELDTSIISTAATTTATPSVEPSTAVISTTQHPNPQENQGPGNANNNPYGPYGQHPPYGPYGYPPPGPYGYPPNFQQQQPTQPPQQQQEPPQQPPQQQFQQHQPEQPHPPPHHSPQLEPVPQYSRAQSAGATAPPTPHPHHHPQIISVGPNPYELQAMLERLAPKQQQERPTATTYTEISIHRKKKKKDKKKKKKKSKHKHHHKKRSS